MLKMLKSDLKIGVYDHFSNYYNTRGVGIITDKQFVFYTQTNAHDGFNHDNAMTFLDTRIYPFKNYGGFYRYGEDIVFASQREYAYLDVPEYISKPQYLFLIHIIDELNRYNINHSKKVNITVENMSTRKSISSMSDVDIKKFVNENFMIRQIREEPREVIIGKTFEQFQEEKLANLNNNVDFMIKQMEQGIDILGTCEYNNQLDINGQPIVENQQDKTNGWQKGYTVVSLLGLMAFIVSIGIIVLGVMFR